MGNRRVKVMEQLDESKARWIIVQKQKGVTNAYMAETMNISVRWVKNLFSIYKNTDNDKIIYLMSMGRSVDGLPGCKEHSAVLAVRGKNHAGAMRLHKRIEENTGIYTPYNKAHKVLRNDDLVAEQPKKSKRCMDSL